MNDRASRAEPSFFCKIWRAEPSFLSQKLKPKLSLAKLQLGANTKTRADRDDYVTILTNNIKPDMMHNFNKNSGYNAFGVRYDGLSIMHYSSRAFSTNGQYTIVSKVNIILKLLYYTGPVERI